MLFCIAVYHFPFPPTLKMDCNFSTSSLTFWSSNPFLIFWLVNFVVVEFQKFHNALVPNFASTKWCGRNCFFTLLIIFFDMRKFLSFIYSHLLIFLLLFFVILVSYLRNHCQTQCPEAFPFCFERIYRFLIFIVSQAKYLWTSFFNFTVSLKLLHMDRLF